MTERSLRRLPIVLVALAAATVVIAAIALDRGDPDQSVPDGDAPTDLGLVASVEQPPVPAPVAAPQTTEELDRVIGVFIDRVATGGDALDHAFLGRLHLLRGRLTDNALDYGLAADVLELGRAIAPDYADSLALLASARLAIHDFSGAAELADELLADDPDRLDALVVAADAAFETGDLDGAEAVLDRLETIVGDDPSLQARRSKIAWIRGDIARAVELAATAEQNAIRLGAEPADTAWYRGYQGVLAFRQGDWSGARRHYESALELHPTQTIALEGLAAITAAEGDYAGAIEQYREALGGGPGPDVTASIGDLYLLLGDEAAAAAEFAKVEGEIDELDPAGNGIFNRFLALFLADHGGDLDRALAITTAELEQRQDVHGWDAHGWVLYRLGRFQEAREASDRAIALDTPDAELWYHAGAISAALGDGDRARAELQRALDLNPGFDPASAQDARRLLDEIG